MKLQPVITEKVAADLKRTVEQAAPSLLAIRESDAARQPAPGKWSPKEIVGHLIDSAVNNHLRFVRAQLQEDLVFPGYPQDEWVQLQQYNAIPWPALVMLWKAFNVHMAHVMAAASPSVRARPRVRHNLHEIAFRTVSETAPATLEYLMQDYVIHLKHHLRQIANARAGDRAPLPAMLVDLGVCIIRDWRPDDAASVARHANNRNVWRNLRDRFPHPYTEDDARQFVDASLAAQPRTNFAIDVGGEAVGSIGVILQDDIERVGAELGYWLGEDYWGRGITTAAVNAVARYALDTFDLKRLYAIAFVWNPASARVLEKAGFKLEGIMLKSAVKDGEVTDQCLYAMTRE
ncbi:MAG: GNAT family N-acetyltransferase [Anaerolineae bacterium]|nr:GNAT family N-acetyltransferase [Gemmatimonadaceae bacterium]